MSALPAQNSGSAAPVQMTAAEYQAKYGQAPAVPVATNSAPVQMTAAQYQTQYGAPPPTPTDQLLAPVKALGKALIPKAVTDVTDIPSANKISKENIAASNKNTQQAQPVLDQIKALVSTGKTDPATLAQLADLHKQLVPAAAATVANEKEYTPTTERSLNLTPGQIIGDSASLGINAGLALEGGGAIADLATGGAEKVAATEIPKTLGQKALGLAKNTALSGTTGYGFDVAQNLSEGKTGGAIAKPGAGTAVGLLAPGALEVVGGIAKLGGSAYDVGKRIFNPVTDEEKALSAHVDTEAAKNVENGVPPTAPKTPAGEVVPEKAPTQENVESVKVPKYTEYLQEAQKQGVQPKEINFVSSLSPEDRQVGKEMYMATRNADKVYGPASSVRAADILGQNGVDLLKGLQTENSKAGKAVATAAEGLKGATVDATPVKNAITQTLSDHGITVNPEDGKLDFSQSHFDKELTPADTNYIEKVFQKVANLPAGENDAQQLHILKKQLDPILEYGKNPVSSVTSEPVRIARSFRASLDNTLDANFPEYNKANTDFKTTQDVLDQAHSIIGKKVDFNSPSSNKSFGQTMRTLLSNNKGRGALSDFLETLQGTADKYGVGKPGQNLANQEYIVNMLEKHFGSEAATGLASEVAKGINASDVAAHATKVGEFIKAPLESAGKAVQTIQERLAHISPEARKVAVGRLFGVLPEDTVEGGSKVKLPSEPQTPSSQPTKVINAAIPKTQSTNVSIPDITASPKEKVKLPTSKVVRESETGKTANLPKGKSQVNLPKKK